MQLQPSLRSRRQHSTVYNQERTYRRPSLKTKQEVYWIMPLVQIFVILIVVGVLLWLVNSFIPMAGSIKSILNAVVVILVVLWLLNIFGLLHSLSNIHWGK